MRAERIVKRQNLKDKYKAIRIAVNASRPLMEAQKRLREAHDAGVQQGFKMAVAEIKAAEDAKAKANISEGVNALVEGANVAPVPNS